MDKKVLIISYFFPPSSSTGGTRPFKFVKYLPQCGWKPLILTAEKPFDFNVPFDQSLMDQMPPEAKIYRTKTFEPLNDRYLKKNIAQHGNRVKKKGGTESSNNRNVKISFLKKLAIECMNIPDCYLGWSLFAIKRGMKIFKEEHFDLIFATSPCPTGHIVGYILSYLTGRPLVLDYQDPWGTPHISRERMPLFRNINRFMENRILKRADKIIEMTTPRLIDLMQKYGIPQHKGAVLPNGYDSEDFPDELPLPDRQKLKFIHTGQLYSDDGVQEFLTAIKELVEEKKLPADKVRIEFVGTRPSTAIFDDLNRKGVCDHISRMPKGQALRKVAASHVPMVFLTDREKFKGCIVSKIFDYMMFDKPIFGIMPESETERLFTRYDLGYRCGYDVEQIKQIIIDLYGKFLTGKINLPGTSEKSKFDRRCLTKELAGIFDDVIKEK